jgi:hypothetical protein
LREPDFELQSTLMIQRDVYCPRAYALKRKDDRLADLIQRTGGIKLQAYAEGGSSSIVARARWGGSTLIRRRR